MHPHTVKMLRVCLFVLIIATFWGLYSAEESHNFKIQVVESTITKCSDNYFDCPNTELVLGDFNETMATVNGMIKIRNNLPGDLKVAVKVEAQQKNNELTSMFDQEMTFCQYLVNFNVYAGIVTDFWEKEEDKEKPKACPITMGSYLVQDSWVNATRLPPQVPEDVEIYVVSMAFSHTEPDVIGFKFRAQIIR